MIKFQAESVSGTVPWVPAAWPGEHGKNVASGPVSIHLGNPWRTFFPVALFDAFCGTGIPQARTIHFRGAGSEKDFTGTHCHFRIASLSSLVLLRESTTHHRENQMRDMMKFVRTLATGAALTVGLAGAAIAQDVKFFTIGTGGTAYTYYPVGGVIANAISKPPGSRPCDEGGSCGVDGLIASAVSSRGSVDNVNAIVSGLRNSGFAQSDVAYWAYTGTGTMDGQPPAENLRTIAALFEEHIHLVAKADSGIDSVADLEGKRVSLDEPGSGTYVDAGLILEANGLSIDDVTAEALKGNAASDALRNGRIDAFFVVAGYPTGSLVELASAEDIKLVPISGDGADALTDKYGFFAQSDIPAGTYEGIDTTPTVAVGAQWFTSAEEDEELIYQITKALWNDNSRKLLDVGHAKGRTITPDTALKGVGVPLHAGAERFYREAGLLD